MSKKINDWYDQERRPDWYEKDDIDFKSVQKQHKDNIKSLENAKSWIERGPNRPITIAVFHGSGRHASKSCANEMSTTKLLLERGLEQATQELEDKPVVWTYDLREMAIEPCNGCYSTASSLCNFPCSCFPADDVTTKIYPGIMAADILLWSNL